MSLINNFDNLQNADNASGAPWFQVVLPADVATIPDVILDQIGTAITLNGGATAYNIMATVGTVQWTEQPQDVDGRQQYRSVFSFVIPKDRADVLTYAQYLNNRGVIAIVRDANGQSRLMGTVDEPATFRMASRTLGNTDGQRNEHFYEIVLTSNRPVPFYMATSHLPYPAGTCPLPEVTISASNINPDFGDEIQIVITSTDIVPTSHRFMLPNAKGDYRVVDQASNTLNYVVNGSGTVYVRGGASNSASTAYTVTGQALTIGTNSLIEEYPQLKGFSLRILDAGFHCPLVAIRRSSDNAVSSFYADLNLELSGNSLNGYGTTLTSWLSGSDGYVVYWFGQGSHGLLAYQSNAGNQPQIAASGAVITDNGRPCIQFNGSNQFLYTNSGTIAQSITYFVVHRKNASAGSGLYTLLSGDTSGGRVQIFHNTSTYQIFAGSTLNSGITSSNQILSTAIFDSASTDYYYQNGSILVSGSAGSNSLSNNLIIGAQQAGIIPWHGNIQEVLLSNTNEFANRAAIEGMINTHYSIY